MATKKAHVEPVGIGAKQRQTHAWFETLAEKVKDAAIKRRRLSERTKGSQLKPEQVVSLADELERIQWQINSADNRRKMIVEQLVAHWAHTGIEEITGELGKTLISLSFELGVDQAILKEQLSNGTWMKVTDRTVNPAKLLVYGKKPGLVRDAIEQAMLVRKLKVSVTPPSSRRAKSAAADDEDMDEAA